MVIQSRNIFFLKNWFAEEEPIGCFKIPIVSENSKRGAPRLVVKIDKEMGHPVPLDIPTMIKVGKVVWH